MKRKNSYAPISTRRKRARTDNSSGAVSAIVRKEMRKKVDWKYTDYLVNATNMYSTGNFYSLVGNLTRGNEGFNNFEGNLIKPQGLTFKYFCHSSNIRNAFRVMIIQWFDSTIPTLATLLQNSVSIGNALVSPINVSSKANVKVLYDRCHQIAPTAGGDTTVVGEAVTDPVSVYIPGKRLRPLKYTTGAVQVSDGCLYVFTVSDDAIAPAPQIIFNARITFSD